MDIEYYSQKYKQPFPTLNYLTHISEKYNYVYTETPKAACTSIKYVLQSAERGSEIKLENPGIVHDRSISPLSSISNNIETYDNFFMGDKYLTHADISKSIKLIEKLKVPLTIFEVLTVVYILNASKQNVDYHLEEAGALMKLDSTNVFDFPLAQIVVNINKQHLNFLKKKTLNEVIYQKVGFLSNFTHIYVGKQKPNVLKISTCSELGVVRIICSWQSDKDFISFVLELICLIPLSQKPNNFKFLFFNLVSI